MVSRINRGRQKIEIKKIEKDTNRQVTFSKRRSSIFKKASELCTLTGAQIAIIVKTSNNKNFSFGHPYVEAVFDRYLSVNSEPPANISTNEAFFENLRNMKLENLNADYTTVNDELLNCMKQNKALKKIEMEDQAAQWYKRSSESMDKEQLDSLMKDLIELHGIVTQLFEELQRREVDLMQHNTATGVKSAFTCFMPPRKTIVGPSHEENSLNHA